MKPKTRLTLTIAITIILVIAFIVTLVMLIIENGQCVDDPFRYSAIKLKESGGNYACSCKSLDSNLADFSFSEEGIEIIKPVYTHTYANNSFNFSNINITK